MDDETLADFLNQVPEIREHLGEKDNREFLMRLSSKFDYHSLKKGEILCKQSSDNLTVLTNIGVDIIRFFLCLSGTIVAYEMKNAMELTTERKQKKNEPQEVVPAPKSERPSLASKRLAIVSASYSKESHEGSDNHHGYGHEKEHTSHQLALHLKKNVLMAIDHSKKKEEPEGKQFANPWDGFIYNNENLR